MLQKCEIEEQDFSRQIGLINWSYNSYSKIWMTKFKLHKNVFKILRHKNVAIHVTCLSSISYCSNLRLITNMLFEHRHPFYTFRHIVYIFHFNISNNCFYLIWKVFKPLTDLVLVSKSIRCKTACIFICEKYAYSLTNTNEGKISSK